MTSIKHIVVEGPDGSGKTTLINELLTRMPEAWDLHPRFTHSTNGPHPNLAQLVRDDMSELSLRVKPWIYDRHPLVGEYIYGPACRGSLAQGFEHNGWRGLMTDRLTDHAVLVLCLPPWHIVNANMMAGQHVAGVMDNAYRIYSDYARVLAEWPGVVIPYDYTIQKLSAVYETLRKVAC
jgi:hypothetical protein